MIYKHKLTKLNSSKYCYVSLTVQLNISHLFTRSQMINNSISNYSVQHASFVYPQFKCQTVIFDPLIGAYQLLPL